MALINKLEAIGDAIRNKTGQTDKLTLEDMVEAINSLSTGGGMLQTAVITRSGYYTFDLSNYVDNNDYMLFYTWGDTKCMHIPGAKTVNTISRKGATQNGAGIKTLIDYLDNISDYDNTIGMINDAPNVIVENNTFKIDYVGTHVGVSAVLVYVG